MIGPAGFMAGPKDSPVREHEWVRPNKLVRWDHCGVCGIIKRRDGKNSPICKGTPRVTVRTTTEHAK